MAETRAHSSPGDTPAIVVVGSMNTDLVTYVDRAPGPGETVIGTGFRSGFGGKGANQAVMARLLGADVAFIGALGADAYAAETLANFARFGIDASGVMRVGGPSGLAPIWVEADGTNRIIVVPGANNLITMEHALAAIVALDRIDVCIGQFEIPQSVTAAAFHAARLRGATTVLNPAPAALIEPDLLTETDWLIPNEIEFGILSEDAGEVTDAGLLAFAARTGTRLVVTLGAHGAALVSSDGTVTRIPAHAVAVVDTTGAGDAFVGAFSVGLGLALTDLDAVQLGIACASASVAHPGTQASFPRVEEAAGIIGRFRGP